MHQGGWRRARVHGHCCPVYQWSSDKGFRFGWERQAELQQTGLASRSILCIFMKISSILIQVKLSSWVCYLKQHSHIVQYHLSDTAFALAAQSSCQIDLCHLCHQIAVMLFKELKLLGALVVAQCTLCWALLRIKDGLVPCLEEAILLS